MCVYVCVRAHVSARTLSREPWIIGTFLAASTAGVWMCVYRPTMYEWKHFESII